MDLFVGPYSLKLVWQCTKSCHMFFHYKIFFQNRAEDNIYLTMFNRIFLNEHNRIAKELYYLNPSWDDEYLFQEARKINIAEYQHIIYYEFLPMILGGASMNKWGLIPTPPGYYFNHYNKDTNPQVKNGK